MSRRLRLGTIAATVAVAAVLSLPVAGATGSGGPVAQKAGAVVNYATLGKIKIRKQIKVSFVCSVPCSVTSILTIKGPFAGSDTQSATDVPAGQLLTHFVTLTKKGLAAMKENPGKFKVASIVTGTNTATGATETISKTFRLKR